MSLLWQARFFTSVAHLDHLPNLPVPEVAFAGRSNAGKSSALNILCNQKKLAFSSKTPGRTQHINYFSIGGAYVNTHRKDPTKQDEIQAFLVDLPGYGYAEVPQAEKQHWEVLLGNYVRIRPQLSALILIIDARRPITPIDIQMLEWFAPTGKPIHCLLTKADKLNHSECQKALQHAHKVIAAYPYGSEYTVQLFSTLKRIGLEEANNKICTFCHLSSPPKTE